MTNPTRQLIVIAALVSLTGCYTRNSVPPSHANSHMERYEYQCWEGGPHIVVPNAVAASWTGHQMGANPLDPNTDYGRACTVERWYGFIDVGDKRALVIPDPPLAAWDPSSTQSQHYFFVLWAWETEDTDGLIDRAKSEVDLKSTGETWDIPTDGARMIYAGDDPTGTIVGRIDIPKLAGTYKLSTGEYNVDDDGHVFVLRFDSMEDQTRNKGK